MYLQLIIKKNSVLLLLSDNKKKTLPKQYSFHAAHLPYAFAMINLKIFSGPYFLSKCGIVEMQKQYHREYNLSEFH